MKPIVIALTGEAHSGKDTCADYLVERFNSENLFAIKVCLADKLKLVCQKLVKLFYNIEIPLGEFYDIQEKEKIRNLYPEFAGQPFKLRTVLQQVGTEVFRDLLWATVWCDYIKKTKIANCKQKIIIISDCRYLDEIQYFEELVFDQLINFFISCRITRENKTQLSVENRNHLSELQISSLPVNLEIQNNGTFDDLYQKIDEKVVDYIKNKIMEFQ